MKPWTALAFAALVLLVSIALAHAPARAQSETPGQTVTLPKGTPVYLQLTRALSSDVHEEGDQVYLAVTRPVKADGYVVISEGAPAVGRVTEVRRAEHEGKAGFIQFKVVSVTAEGNVNVFLSSGMDGATGEDSETSTTIFGMGCCPFLLFTRGDEASYPIGTEAEAFVAENVSFPVQGLKHE